MRVGKFLVLEGGDGAGKTTAAEFIVKTLKDLGVDVVHTREPGGTPIAEGLRETLLKPNPPGETMHPLTELGILCASRAQHLQTKIHPALEAGQWVFCERYVDSTYAYQGVARGQDIEAIVAAEKIFTGGFRPDHVILLDADPELLKERMAGRKSLDRLEKEVMTFHQNVRKGFLERAEQYFDQYLIVDATQSIEEVQGVLGDFLGVLVGEHFTD